MAIYCHVIGVWRPWRALYFFTAASSPFAEFHRILIVRVGVAQSSLPARSGALRKLQRFLRLAVVFKTQSQVIATLEDVGMLRAEHSLADREHRAILPLRLGMLALAIQRSGQIVPVFQGLGIVKPQLCGAELDDFAVKRLGFIREALNDKETAQGMLGSDP